MKDNQHITVIIPARNEQAAISDVVRSLPNWVDDVVVADNGSTDATARLAAKAGARIVDAPQRGYGAACQAAIAAIDDTGVVVFMDGDGSDYPEEMTLLVDPILTQRCDIVIGSRATGVIEPGAMTLPQLAGNRLACFLIRLKFGVTYTDLGPFRAIRWSTLKTLPMTDRDYGWTVQLQLLAITLGLRLTETPVTYRRRIGVSKISGTLRGVFGAGTKIIWLILKHPGLTQRSPSVSASQNAEESRDRRADQATSDDKIAASLRSRHQKDTH